MRTILLYAASKIFCSRLKRKLDRDEREEVGGRLDVSDDDDQAKQGG